MDAQKIAQKLGQFQSKERVVGFVETLLTETAAELSSEQIAGLISRLQVVFNAKIVAEKKSGKNAKRNKKQKEISKRNDQLYEQFKGLEDSQDEALEESDRRDYDFM